MPHLMIREGVDAGEAVRILPDWSRIPVPIHAVFASSRYMNPAVRAFVDLAVERTPQQLDRNQ